MGTENHPAIKGMRLNCQFGRYRFSALTGTLVAVTLGLCPAVLAVDRSFEASGEVSHRVLIRGQTVVEMYRDFRVRVSDCDWNIITRDIGTNKFHPAIAAWETGCDGRDTFAITRFDKQPRPTRVLGPNNNFETATITNMALPDIAQVDPGMIPARGPSFHAFVWFSLASRCYLDGAPKDRLGQIWEYEDPERQYKEVTMNAQVERLDAALGLPRRAAFFSDGKYYVSKDGRPAVIEDKAPYDKGWTNAVYAVTDSTNFQGLRIPLTFTLVRYVTKPQGVSSNDLLVFEETVGHVKEVTRRGSRAEFLPANEPNRPVRDNRFRGDTQIPIIAKSAADKWLDRNAVQALPSFKAQSAGAEQFRRERDRAVRLPVYRWATYAAFALLAAIPFAVVFVKRKAKSK